MLLQTATTSPDPQVNISVPADAAAASRNPGLDGLRGVAALSVALGHSVLQVGGIGLWGSRLRDFPAMPWTDILVRLISALAPSDAAVIVFFVLSGHVLWSSFQRKNLRFLADLPDYACARLYRLFPLAIASGLLLGLSLEASARDLALNMLLLSHSLNGVLWSLQVEVVASLSLFAVWGVTRATTWKLLLAFAISMGATAAFRGNPYIVFFPAFILGASISLVPVRILQRRWIVAAAITVLILTNVILGHGGITRCFEMAAATILVGAVSRGQLQFLRSRTIMFLGAISYPFYLTHWVVLAAAGWIMDQLSLGSPYVGVAITAAVSVTLTIPVAWLLHVGVETPALKARPRLPRGPGGRPARLRT